MICATDPGSTSEQNNPTLIQNTYIDLHHTPQHLANSNVDSTACMLEPLNLTALQMVYHQDEVLPPDITTVCRL
eukprot:1419868-Amphidinium_carterae.3